MPQKKKSQLATWASYDFFVDFFVALEELLNKKYLVSCLSSYLENGSEVTFMQCARLKFSQASM